MSKEQKETEAWKQVRTLMNSVNSAARLGNCSNDANVICNMIMLVGDAISRDIVKAIESQGPFAETVVRG